MNPVNREKMEIVEKFWGKEEIVINCDEYCCKYLYLNKGYRCSLHYHKIKKETFRVIKGKIIIQLIHKKYAMNEGDFVTINPGTYHSFYGMEDSVILEVSTTDFKKDSYRHDKSSTFCPEDLESVK